MARRAVGWVAAALALAGPAAAWEHPQPEAQRRGPFEWRDEWLLAQPRLALAASSPDLLPAGAVRLRLDFDWGNDFGWSQSAPGEEPSDRRYLIDGEHRSLVLGVRGGLSPGLELGLRLPLRWRGGGILDGVIDSFHGRTGLPDNGRDRFTTDLLRVEGHSPAGVPVEWSGAPGYALGNLELELKRALKRDDSGWRLAAAARLGLPTGTGSFAGAGIELGGQLLAARGIGRRFDVYLGAGATWWAERERDGIRYAPARGHGFLALEWRATRSVSLLLQADAASRLVRDVARLPGVHSYLRFGAKLRLAPGWTLEAGLSENLTHQQATTDVGLGLGLSRQF